MVSAPRHRYKKDAYASARGKSRLFLLSCERCAKRVGLYQKDGPGPLKRLYLDRFFSPPALVALAAAKSVKALPPLRCSGCKEELGIPMVYEKEGRLAYKLFQSTVAKKIQMISRSSSGRSR